MGWNETMMVNGSKTLQSLKVQSWLYLDTSYFAFLLSSSGSGRGHNRNGCHLHWPSAFQCGLSSWKDGLFCLQRGQLVGGYGRQSENWAKQHKRKEMGRETMKCMNADGFQEEAGTFFYFQVFFKFRCSGPLSTSKLRTALPVAGPSSLQGCLRI